MNDVHASRHAPHAHSARFPQVLELSIAAVRADGLVSDQVCCDTMVVSPFTSWLRQAVFRPEQCDRMAASVSAVVHFAEGPLVGGSRSLGPDELLPAIGMVRDRLPDIGIGPRALLLHAIDHPEGTGGDLPCTKLDEWLAGLRPSLTQPAIMALYSFIEGDAFRCSTHMAVEDLAIGLTDDVLATVPGLPALARLTVQAGLRTVRQRIGAASPLPAGPSSPLATPPPGVPVTSAALPQIAMAGLQKRRVLGAGSFGEVYLAWWEGGHMEVAVKANGINCVNTAAIDNERRLLELLLRHPHKNILVVYGIVTDASDGAVRLVMMHCAGGSLDAYLTGIRERGEVCMSVCESFSLPVYFLA